MNKKDVQEDVNRIVKKYVINNVSSFTLTDIYKALKDKYSKMSIVNALINIYNIPHKQCQIKACYIISNPNIKSNKVIWKSNLISLPETVKFIPYDYTIDITPDMVEVKYTIEKKH